MFFPRRVVPRRRVQMQPLVVSASSIFGASSCRRSLCAIVAEGRGRSMISNNGDVQKNRPTGAAEALEQFADRLRQQESSKLSRQSKDRAGTATTAAAATSTSQDRATLRWLARRLFESYPSIPWYHPEKQGWEKTRVLQFLADDCSAQRDNILEAAESFVSRSNEHQQQQSASATHAPSYTSLQHVCVPEYQRILTQLLVHQPQADQGIAFLLLLRRDLLNWISYLQERRQHDDRVVNYQQLDHYLFQLLQTWFAPGLLQVDRITYDTTSASIIEKIARNEAVHPVQNLQDLRQRLGADRRVYCVFHRLLPQRPLLVLYVSLNDQVPTCMEMIYKSSAKNYGSSTPSIKTTAAAINSSSASTPSVATFYSISNFEAGLKGVGLGEYLIHQAVDCLQMELPKIHTFCTLSPLPKFRVWLEQTISRASNKGSGTKASDDGHNKFARSSTDLLGSAALSQQLANRFQVDVEQAMPALVQYLQTLNHRTAWEPDEDEDGSNPIAPLDDDALLQRVLLRLAAHYVIHEKRRNRPLDPVAGFHIGNGAMVHALRWKADTSRKGWVNSYGVMVNYEYDFDKLAENQAQYEQARVIPMRDAVKELLDG